MFPPVHRSSSSRPNNPANSTPRRLRREAPTLPPPRGRPAEASGPRRLTSPLSADHPRSLIMTTTVSKPSDLLSLAGTDLGSSDWLEIPQSDIDLFATATHDEQWIHVDVERARTGPFKGTIAHGYLTLSLLIPLWPEILVIEERGMAVNYGLNKLRFPAPVP